VSQSVSQISNQQWACVKTFSKKKKKKEVPRLDHVEERKPFERSANVEYEFEGTVSDG
jgi:hypothetical protein